MTTSQIEIQLIAAVTAAACSLPGVFLVLRRMAMLSDAIGHAMLIGIVLAFFLVESLTSPLLIVGAALAGVATVALVELLERTGRIRADAAIGLVFPLLFSLGVILIAREAGNTHLDTDAVLLGDIAFAPFDRLVIGGWDLGPRALVVMSAILALNALLLLLFFKELKLATFDAALAAALGFTPALIHYGLMGVVSVTAVGAFSAVGAILVVALMIGPPVTASLLTTRLRTLILLSMAIGAASGVAGYWLAWLLDASIAGSIAAMIGASFLVALIASPSQGLVAAALLRNSRRRTFAETMLAIHLFNHAHVPADAEERKIAHLEDHLRWPPRFSHQVVRQAERHGLIQHRDGVLWLTPSGEQRAREAIVRG